MACSHKRTRRTSIRAARERLIRRGLARVLLVMALGLALTGHAQVILIGSQQIQPQSDSNPAGMAEAFKTTAMASGIVASISVYVDSGSAASKLITGLYADTGGKPGALLGQGTLNGPVAGGWNTVVVSNIQVSAGADYWIAVLSPAKAGTIKFRDKFGGGASETSASKTLTALPAAWATGKVYTDSPLAAYASVSGSIQPILSVSPASLSFAYSQGGISPAPALLSVANTGAGTLSFSAATNADWLSVSPASGTAPQTEQVTATVSGLATGTYTGQVTISASGAQGSPAAVPVTLIV